MMSPSSANRIDNLTVGQETGSFVAYNNELEPPCTLDQAVAAALPLNVLSKDHSWEPSEPKSEEVVPTLAKIPEGIIANDPVSGVDDSTLPESSKTNTSQIIDAAPRVINDAVPRPLGDGTSLLTGLKTTEPRTTGIQQKLFKSAKAHDLPATEGIKEARDKFHQTLVRETPTSTTTNVDKPSRQFSDEAGDEVIKAGGESEPIIVDSDHEDEDAAARLRDLKRRFEQKKKKNLLSLEDEVEYRRLINAENIRQRTHHRRQSYQAEEDIKEEDPDDALFLGDGDDIQELNPTTTIGDNETAGTAEEPPKKKHRPNRANKVSAKAIAEDVEAGWEASKSKREKEASKKTRKPRTAANKDGSPRVSKKKSKGKEKNASKDKSKRKGPTMLNMNSLFDNDIIGAAQANQKKGDLPTFKSTKKAEALKELIASMPQDQQKLASVDKRALEKATRSFSGHGSMKADGDGNWRLKGMRTSLKPFQVLGVSFMRERENSGSRPFGGLDADVMGLGMIFFFGRHI
jgi:hypothetical protein